MTNAMPAPAGPPPQLVRAVEVRRAVDLEALAEEISTALGVPVVLGGLLPESSPNGVGRIMVRDAATGAPIDAGTDVVALVVEEHVPPVRLTPAEQLAADAEQAGTVAELAAAVAAYARSLGGAA